MTFCATCGAVVDVGATKCSHCLSDQPLGAKAQAYAAPATYAPVASGAEVAGGWVRYGSRLLLLGGDIAAGMVLAVLVVGLIRSAGQLPASPGQTAPHFVAPIIAYPTPSQVAGTPSAAPHAPTPTPTPAAHRPSSGSGPVATPTPTPSPTAPPPPPSPTPTSILPTPTPSPTVGQFQ